MSHTNYISHYQQSGVRLPIISLCVIEHHWLKLGREMELKI